MDDIKISTLVHEIESIQTDTMNLIGNFMHVAIKDFAQKLVPILKKSGANPKDIAIFEKWILDNN